jgi:hypothetical protein
MCVVPVLYRNLFQLIKVDGHTVLEYSSGLSECRETSYTRLSKPCLGKSLSGKRDRRLGQVGTGPEPTGAGPDRTWIQYYPDFV